MSPLAGKGTWHLLRTTPAILPTATKHFDRADLDVTMTSLPHNIQCTYHAHTLTLLHAIYMLYMYTVILSPHTVYTLY